MKNENSLLNNRTDTRCFTNETDKMQSLQDKTGATAEQIRKAMEKVGFDREKVEQYLKGNLLEDGRDNLNC
jgi:hypothetical protein